MWYITVIRILAVLVFGISVYAILLWIVGWRFPGCPRRKINDDIKSGRKKAWIVFIYNLILVFIVTLVFILIKSFARGEI